ncbi:MAG: glycosyl transferase family 6 [Lachnospiraceae bacterium]|nr:glycosyl transferase family 6 [Lachnospiraceae bacterium]
MKIAILYIAIGQYTVFFDSFFRSCQKFFMPDSEKMYFVFSDKEDESFTHENVKVYKVEDMGWPDNTLKRFHMFTSIEEELCEYSYCFFFNANLEFKEKVVEKILPKQGIVVVQHPGYYNKHIKTFPYDHNPESLAYIPQGRGKVYVCGGVNGGCTKEYLDMCKVLKERVDLDYQNGVIARWHDESHLNRFIFDLKGEKYVIWHPGFCYPDFYRMPFPDICHLKDKNYYIDVPIQKKEKLPLILKLYLNFFSKQNFKNLRIRYFKKRYFELKQEGKDLGYFPDKAARCADKKR